MQKRIPSIIVTALTSALLFTALILLLRGPRVQAAVTAAVDTRGVGSEASGVELSPGCTKRVDPGVVVIYTHSLTNGLMSRTISLTHHSSQGWTVTHMLTAALSIGQIKTFTVSVTVPDDGAGKTDVTTITATWKTMSGRSSVTAADTTLVRQPVHKVYLPAVVRGYRTPIRDWSRGGLAGKQVYQIAVCDADPNRLYAGTETGVFRSSDAGASWQATALQGVAVRGLDVAPDDCDEVYAATFGQYVQCTKDGGVSSWDTLGAELPNDRFYTVVLDDGSFTSRLYAGTEGNGVYQHSDGAWKPIFGDTEGLVVHRLTLVGSRELLVATWGGNAYRLSHGGLKWNDTPLAVPEEHVFEVAQASNGDLFAATNGHLYRRTGEEWTVVHNHRAYSVAPDPDQVEVIYAAAEDGAWRSTDEGEDFQRFGLDGVVVRDVAPGPAGSTLLHAGTEDGAWRRSRP